MKLDYTDHRPIYEQIKEQTRELILNKALEEHQQLPSVRELASQLTINPNTIQRAYKELEREGYIYSMKAKGYFVAPLRDDVQLARKNENIKLLENAVKELVYLGTEEKEVIDLIENIYKGGRKMIEVKNLNKSFGNFKSLDNLSLNVKKGSVYGLVGPNGAGKTTFIKNLMGIYRPDSGSMTVNGEEVYENPALKQKIIYISDDLFFFTTYSILDTAKLYADIYKDWDWETFNKLKEIFKIDVKRKCCRLSKGMQKQVAFWLGICTKPDLMVLDEPMDGLDPVMRKNTWSLLLQDVVEREMTVLVSSHNLRELEDVCDHVGIMFNGKLVLEKQLDDVKGEIHKLQIAFKDGVPQEFKDSINILHESYFGSVYTCIVRGTTDEITSTANKFNPLICDILPLTLEEIFIYELGGMGYEFENIII